MGPLIKIRLVRAKVGRSWPTTSPVCAACLPRKTLDRTSVVQSNRKQRLRRRGRCSETPHHCISLSWDAAMFLLSDFTPISPTVGPRDANLPHIQTTILDTTTLDALRSGAAVGSAATQGFGTLLRISLGIYRFGIVYSSGEGLVPSSTP